MNINKNVNNMKKIILFILTMFVLALSSCNNNNYSKYCEVLKSYEGKSVDEIKNSNNIVVDNVAGATLTSNRVYQAIKDALK
jgi:uncharacterized protein with FMN-binding domain